MSEEKYLSLIQEYKPRVVVGFDEVGNGAIAGDLCVAACALPTSFNLELKDSKKYTEKARQKAYDTVLSAAIAKKTLCFSALTVTTLGHKRALDTLFFNALYYMYAIFKEEALYILDGTSKVPNVEFEHTCLAKADTYVPAVSAASILAKCERDQRMRETGYEEWQFATHKGYPTQAHLDMLKRNGPIKGVHRTNIETVKKALTENGWYVRPND